MAVASARHILVEEESFCENLKQQIEEGLDFADDIGRAVIITGIPYAAAMDPKVKLKKENQTHPRKFES